MTVLGANTAPVANGDSVTVNEDTSITIDVLANDTDANVNTLTANLVTGPVHGTLTQTANGTFSYIADQNWFGTDSFTYVANDGTANSQTATVSITVNPVNDAPTAQSVMFKVKKNKAVKFDLRDCATDLDGNNLTFSIIQPSHGTVTQNANGTYTYKHHGVFELERDLDCLHHPGEHQLERERFGCDIQYPGIQQHLAC